MTAPKLAGAVSIILISSWIASDPALAYHDTSAHTGAPIGAILPMVIAVAVGVVALALWKPRSRNAKIKKRAPGARVQSKRHKRGR